MNQNCYTYTVKIPHHGLKAVDTVITEYIHTHPCADVEEALDAIFAAGVRLALDGGALSDTYLIKKEDARL